MTPPATASAKKVLFYCLPFTQDIEELLSVNRILLCEWRVFLSCLRLGTYIQSTVAKEFLFDDLFYITDFNGDKVIRHEVTLMSSTTQVTIPIREATFTQKLNQMSPASCLIWFGLNCRYLGPKLQFPSTT